METVFKVIPMDSKGEQDGNTWFTTSKREAAKAWGEGHLVFSAFVEGWKVEFSE